jgi:hypothetical protein
MVILWAIDAGAIPISIVLLIFYGIYVVICKIRSRFRRKDNANK